MNSNFNQAAQNIVVRFSEAADVPTVLSFYDQNRHHNVDFRGHDVFTERTETGRALLIFKPDNSLGLSSMSHTYPATDVVEIGSTLTSMDGFGLYPFVIASQIIHEFLERPPENRFFACIHKPENDAVTKMLNRKVGWHIVTPTQDFADAVGEGPNIDKLSWLHADSDTLSHQSRVVLAAIDKGTLFNKKTGENVTLDLSRFSLATTYRPHLEELANGRFGEMLESSRHLPLQKARQAFERYLGGARYFSELSPKP